jgi:GTPase SAR1 family protein
MASSIATTDAKRDEPKQSSGLATLVTADQSILLDTIDKLRSHGVSQYIKLPQIIVCGNQSSGKSSVLEAISRISFPHGKEVCTTFPTELALRRDSNPSVKIQLKPSSSRTESEKVFIDNYPIRTGGIEDFESLVNGAKNHLRKTLTKDQKTDSVFEDVLHVEVTNPNWPPLSLVDLPGLILSPNPQQTSEDVTIVDNLVEKYMENPKSIILAVVAADYDLPVQKVFQLIKKYDPLGKRTMFVITKPDKVLCKSNDLPQFVLYAQNKLPHYCFELGWHIVRNRGENDDDRTMDERDAAEKEFFAQASWSKRLNRDQLGINKLRERLSILLERHTRSEMPGVLNEIDETLNECREEISKLGQARSTSDAQKLYLITISQRFESLVRQAVNGHYDDASFFRSDLPESNPRKLRAALQNLNEDFARRMRTNGHAKEIYSDSCLSERWPNVNSYPRSNDASTKPTRISPPLISRSAYIQQIKILSRRNRGKELLGSPNFRLVRDLFLDQSRPWRMLAKKHLESVLQCVTEHLSHVSEYVAPPETVAALRREVLFNAMHNREKRVMDKLEELLKPYEKGHPITYDLSYIKESRRLVKDDVKARLEEKQHQKSLGQTTRGDTYSSSLQGLQIDEIMSALKLDADEIGEIECAEIFNCMKAYYEVSILFLPL